MSIVMEREQRTDLLKVKDRIAVVTGAGSGIGRAAALKLAEHGAKVCLVDLKPERLEHVEQELKRFGSQAIPVAADVANPVHMQAAIQGAVDRWGRIDIVFANAGVNGVVTSIEAMEPEEWDQTLETNLKGTFLAVKYAIPHMKTNGGSIIITSSINGSRTFKNIGMSAYSASKAGQVAFGRMAALELSNYGIRVNTICPGAIETNIGQNTHKEKAELKEVEIPVKYPEGNQPLEHRAGQPKQVADLVLFLASDDSKHITGTEIYIDGAESLL